jgi:spartin
MSGHGDPRLLYTVGGIKAYHIQQGEESPLTPSGPQTLSLLMVPTNSPFADLSNTRGQNEAPEEDFYLHLNLPPELDLPLPATTQIYHQPPRSYLIPRWDLGPESGAFTRIEFPPIGKGSTSVTQEDVDTFETILAQCTAFLERAQAPQHEKGKGDVKAYNPQDYRPGEGYVGSGNNGEVVLVDEENGSVVGELAEGAMIHADPALKQGSKSMLFEPFSRGRISLMLTQVKIPLKSSSPQTASASTSARSKKTTSKWPAIPPTKTPALYRMPPPHLASSSPAPATSVT